MFAFDRSKVIPLAPVQSSLSILKEDCATRLSTAVPVMYVLRTTQKFVQLFSKNTPFLSSNNPSLCLVFNFGIQNTLLISTSVDFQGTYLKYSFVCPIALSPLAVVTVIWVDPSFGRCVPVAEPVNCLSINRGCPSYSDCTSNIVVGEETRSLPKASHTALSESIFIDGRPKNGYSCCQICIL